MNTCVLCISRRKLLACTIRSRSRWNAERTSDGGSGVGRVASALRRASGARSRASRISTRSLGETAESDVCLVMNDVQWRQAGQQPLAAIAGEVDRKLLVVPAVDDFDDDPFAELGMKDALCGSPGSRGLAE